MGRAVKTLFGLILLAGMACGPRKKAAVANATAAAQSDLKMFDLHIQSYADARLEWDLKAPIGEMFTNNNVTRLHRMRSELYDNGQRSAEVSSDVALLATGPNPRPVNNVPLEEGDVYLSKNVVMVSSDGTKVFTDWARYSRKNDLVSSTAPVKVVRKDSTTNGIGMEAKPDMSQLKIFSQTLVIHGTDEALE